VEFVKLSIHPLFFACGIACAIFGGLPLFCVCVLTALMHECGHIFYAQRLGYECQKVKLMPFGAAAVCDIEGISIKDEVILSLCGPLVNVVMVCAIAGLWWFFPETYAFTDILLYANLAMLLFNLLPAYPLDGGRVARCLLLKWAGKRAAEWVPRIFSLLLAVGAVVAFFFFKNISLLLLGVFLAFSALEKTTKASLIQFNSYRRLKRGLEVKYVMANFDMTFQQALKHVDGKRYLVLQFYDDDRLEEVTQDELYQKLKTHTLYDKVMAP
jgi:stage IV sporulation protein FB